MRMRPLGWELQVATSAIVALALGILTGSVALVTITLHAIALLTPVVLLGVAIRVVVAALGPGRSSSRT